MSLEDQKCRAWLTDQGYAVEKVEHFNHYTKRKHDLYGFIDYIAVGDGLTIGAQSTSVSNFASRHTKVLDSEHLPRLLEADWVIYVLGFKKGQKAPHRLAVFTKEDLWTITK